MVRKRRDFMCPLNRIFGIFGLSHNFWVVAVQQKASNTTKDANALQLFLIRAILCYTFATFCFVTLHIGTFATLCLHFSLARLLSLNCYTFATLIGYTCATLFVYTLPRHIVSLFLDFATLIGYTFCYTHWLHFLLHFLHTLFLDFPRLSLLHFS